VLITTLQRARRRWYVALIGLLVTVGLVVVVTGLVPATYSATTQLVLLPPHSQEGSAGAGSDSGRPDNPYLGLAELASMTDVVSRAMMDETSAKTLVKVGVTGTYGVQRDTMSAAPILLVTVEDTVPSRASEGLQAVAKEVLRTLSRLQADSSIAQESRITVTEVARPSSPVKSGKGQIRALGVTLVGGLIMTVLATSFVDALILRRRRADAAVGAGAVASAGGPDVDPAELGVSQGEPREEISAVEGTDPELLPREPAR
jgi:hypothetical protein